MKNIKKTATVLAICLIFLLVAGCGQQDSIQKGGTAVVQLKRIQFEGHTYIVDTWYRHGGITHDPDCQHTGN